MYIFRCWALGERGYSEDSKLASNGIILRIRLMSGTSEQNLTWYFTRVFYHTSESEFYFNNS